MKKRFALILLLLLTVSLLSSCNIVTGLLTTDWWSDDKTETSSSSSSSSSSSGYEKGTLSATDFESEYLDLRFTLPDGFVMATEEDMYDMMGIGAELMDISPALVDYANLVTVYEMMASVPTGTTNVILMTEKLPLRNITVEQYFDSVKSQLQNVDTIKYEINDEITSVEIAGSTYSQITASGNISGYTLIQKYMFRKIDNRMVGFIATTTSDEEATLDTLMAGFSPF